MTKYKAPASSIRNTDGFSHPEIGGVVAVMHNDFEYTDITAKTLFTLPAGATPIDWWIDVTVDFNAGTNNNLSLGAGSDADYFAALLAIGTLGVFRFGDTNYVAGRMGVKFLVDTAITAIFVPTGTASSTGTGRFFMSYMMTP